MSFHDDSHILSRLGILDSMEESPKKVKPSTKRGKETPEKETFVEVNINGDVETESDTDDAIFDKDTLLTQSRPRVIRRRVESFTCRYILLMLSYVSLGAVCHSSNGVSNHADNVHKIYVFQSGGMVLGVLLGRLAFYRMSSAFVFVANLLLITTLSVLLYSVPSSVNMDAVSAVQGCVVGILSYGGLCLYFSLWRGHNRKVLWFYALFALGTGVILIFSIQPAVPVESSTHSIVKREAPVSVLSTTSIEDANSTETRPKKPQVAQGISSISTKTQQNEEMRGKAQEKDSAGNSTDGGSDEQKVAQTTSTTMTSTESTTTSSTASTTTSTMPHRTTTTPVPQPVVEVKTTIEDKNRRGKERYQLSIPDMNEYLPSTSAELFLLILLLICSTLHILGFICCSTPCRLGADSKIVKLRDPAMASFTLGCKVRLVAFYTICGLVESVLLMYLTSDGRNNASLFPWASFSARFMTMIPGPWSYSLSVVFMTAFIGLCSSVGLLMGLAPSVSLVLLCSTCGVLPLLVLLNIESRLSPRPSILIDNLLAPHFAGRFLAAFFCWLLMVSNFLLIISISCVLLNLLLIFLIKSVNKAVRLKEIMEYTGGSTQTTSLGDYLALVEHDHLTMSDEDEEYGIDL